ncbi:hypothetical protein I350_04570 [Cryptococcus amylolentus CBS 6273]|uniref:Uncharacterized protein n=1 Tax=Cryptococcus amylolentus CBS 6273 TaxID=1296118 RepID=A0A1E3JXD6_9TREE|nr:hypothetical protein I350_04570 [Cryptococcus amylolentus CBS 6273]
MENEHIETIIHKNNVVLSFEFTPARTWLKIVLTSDGHVLVAKLLPSIGQGTTQSRCVAYNNSTALFRFGTPSAFGNENNRQTFFQVEFADTDAILSILAFHVSIFLELILILLGPIFIVLKTIYIFSRPVHIDTMVRIMAAITIPPVQVFL